MTYIYSSHLVEWVVKNTRTMEASIVVIAFQKEIVKMVKVKVEVERFGFITNPMLLTSAGREWREGVRSAPTQFKQMHQETKMLMIIYLIFLSVFWH